MAPHSILVTYEGRVKLLGTGFAQVRRALERRLGTLTADIDYAAPELLLGYSAGPSADLYGVGVMLWEAVAGSRRVFGKTRGLTIRQRTSGEEPDVEQACPGAPPALADICRRALRVSPRHRYATAMELKHDLVSYLTSAGGHDENALAPALARLMHGSFAAERAEMQLFIGSSLGDDEDCVGSSPGARSSAEPPLVQGDDWDDETHIVASELGADDDWDDETHIVASELGTDEDWNDETHIVASNVDAASDVEPIEEELDDESSSVASDRGLSALEASLPSEPSPVDVAPEPNPKRDSYTGGHRAFSTSLAQPAVTSPRYSRWAVPGSAALLVLVGIVSVARMSREHQSASTDEAVARRRPARNVEGTPRAASLPPLELARTEDIANTAARASLTTLARVPVRSPVPEVVRPDHDTDTSVGSASPDAGSVPEAAPTSAFLGAAPDGFEPSRAGGSVAGRVIEPQPGILPSDLPIVDEDRDLLQQAILAAARARRPRASPFGRGPHDKKAAKAAAKATSQNGAAAVPRPIDETDPYEERAAP